jgi:type VII secretion-associated serine protease mycosin
MRRLGASVLVGVVVLLATARPAMADDIRDKEWHLSALGMSQAQKVSQGDGVVVAVVDTGVDDKHAELTGAVLPGKGFGEGNNTDGRVDQVGHGTAMAGLIAGRGLSNGGGVLGIAPKARILPVQVARTESTLPSPWIGPGIDWAVDHGAKVINLSMELGDDGEVRAAVERALRSDVIVVAGVGNTPARTTVGFPASIPGVVAVGGVDRNGDHAAISATGPEMQVAAPSVDVISTAPGSDYRIGTGTSDATAIVSGVVALVRAKYPNLSGPEVVRRITATATDKGQPGRDDEYGFGVVNPVAALTADIAPATQSSSASTVAASSSSVADGGGSGGSPVRVAAVAAGGAALVLLVGLMLWRMARVRR